MPERLKSPLLMVVLFIGSFYVCRELFHVEYLRHMGSIEGAYIGISRYAIAHWRDLRWFPLWYGGIPYQNTYPPLLHWGVALVAAARGITVAHAYHWTVALAYCLGPITLFALVRRLSGSRWAGFTAGLIYMALSPSTWLMPDVAADIGSHFRGQRLRALAYWGEGPHVSAMTLLPLAFLMVDLAVRKRKTGYIAGAAVACAAVVLTNWLAGFALGLGVAAYVLAAVRTRRDLAMVAGIAVAAYGLAMPWAPPSTIAVTQYNAKVVAGDFRTVYQTLPMWAGVVVGSLALLKWLARRLPQGLQFAVFFTFLTGLITLSNDWFGAAIVPQPLRYHLEMEMGLAMLAGLVGYEIFRRTPQRVAIAAMVAFSVLVIPPLRVCRRYARTFLITTVDITKTSEWKTADWLNRNWTGERVMLPGSEMFWLTAFSDTPEIGGGFAQGITNQNLMGLLYGITAGVGGKWPEWSVLWLKALGVQAVGVSGEGSTEVFRDFLDPKKFDGLLEVLRRDGGDVLYRVGKARRSLARVVPRKALVVRRPVSGEDVETVRSYVEALDDAAMPEARFEWTSGHSARVAAALGAGQVVSIQMAWHPGWHARAGDRALAIEKDELGLMVVSPGDAGSFELSYDGGWEMKVAGWVCGITVVGLIALVVVRRGI